MYPWGVSRAKSASVAASRSTAAPAGATGVFASALPSLPAALATGGDRDVVDRRIEHADRIRATDRPADHDDACEREHERSTTTAVAHRTRRG